MIGRKKKLRIIQSSLLIVGLLIIFFTYYNKNQPYQEQIISKASQEKMKKQLLKESTSEGDVFYNIEYSGLDLAGNRYNLKSKEAYNSKIKNVVNMKFVEGIFYFKNDTILYIWSDKAVYNNITLDISFTENVVANYGDSELFADKADFSNSQGFLTISNNVRIKDDKGTMRADKLFFDVKKQTLDVASFNENKINTNINIK
mgnify:FL=1